MPLRLKLYRIAFYFEMWV